MKRRRPDEPFESDSPTAALTLTKSMVQRMVSQEVQSAVSQTDKMMKALMERIQEIDSEPQCDARIKKLEAHVKKIKRRGDVVFSFIRKHGTELLQNQQKSLASPHLLTSETETRNLSSANGECSSDSTSASAEIDCEGAALRKPKEGFWQSLRSKKQVVDLTDDDEVSAPNGKRHSDSPLIPQTSAQKNKDDLASPLEQTKSPAVEENKTSVREVQATLHARFPPLPDTPFPHELPLAAATQSMPQKPLVKVARIDKPQGIALLWNVEKEDPHAAKMDCYYIYVAQECHDGTLSKWKTMGELKAIPLPMACRVSDRCGDKKLYFVIVGKDIYGRYGPYSEIYSVLPCKI